jgi:molybdate transport system substrate-binding protein
MASRRALVSISHSRIRAGNAASSDCAPFAPFLLVAFVAFCVTAVASGCSRAQLQPRSLRIAAAADLKPALDEIAAEFHRGNPAVEISSTYGSSGGFSEQIKSGAPFDIFLSADVDYPRRLLQAGIGASDSLFLYAVGSIAVWVRVDSGLDPATVLQSRPAGMLAIANPAHAPYGRAAVAAMHSLEVYDAWQGRLALGENVSQALEFARTGAADAAIVARSLALSPALSGVGRYWSIPASAYPRMDQAGLIVTDTAQARAFRSFLLSAKARATLANFGFAAPEAR